MFILYNIFFYLVLSPERVVLVRDYFQHLEPVDFLSFLLTVVSWSVTRPMMMFNSFVSWASSFSPYRVRGQVCYVRENSTAHSLVYVLMVAWSAHAQYPAGGLRMSVHIHDCGRAAILEAWSSSQAGQQC